MMITITHCITVVTLCVVLLTVLLQVTGAANGFTGANITDGNPRLAIIQNEDFSISVYETINGTTEQIAGFGNNDDDNQQQQSSKELQQSLLKTNQAMYQLGVLIQELTQTIKQIMISVEPVYASTAFSSGPLLSDGVQVSNPVGTDASMNLSIIWSNQTVAATTSQTITSLQGNNIVLAINAIIAGREFEYNPDDLELLLAESKEEPEESEETTESDSGSGSGGDGGDSSDDPIEADPSQGNPGDDIEENGTGDSDDSGGETDIIIEDPQPRPEPEAGAEVEPQNTTCMIAPYCGNNIIQPHSL